MTLFSMQDLEQSAELVYQHMSATAQYSWPLINKEVGAEVWVKHENHTPAGAFKVRGGITFIDWLSKAHPDVKGIVTATRGNHGQSQARAAVAAGLTATIVVPEGNSKEKNAAMEAFGAKLIIEGADFDVARGKADEIAVNEKLYPVAPFHSHLVMGVSTYALELFSSVPDIDTVYVPVGCGSGICGLITARDLLGLSTKIVGVVSTEAQAVKLSYDSGIITQTESANTFADGMAVRAVIPEAYAVYSEGAQRIVAVTDDAVAQAIRLYYKHTHNLAEGAGAAPLAALMQEKAAMRGKKVAVILCGGNIDTDIFVSVMNGQTPKV